MRSRGRVLLAIVIPLVTLSAAGCTGGGGTPPSTPPSGGIATSNAPVTFKPGEYRYAFDNITASLVLHGSDGTLEILNQSGGDVGAPAVYVITGDDQRFDGQIPDAVPIAKGSDVTFDVTFPPEVTAKTVGLVALILGSDNMGTFAPVAEGPAA